MFAFLGGLKAVSDLDEAMQGKTKKLTVSLGRHEFRATTAVPFQGTMELWSYG